ncbi:MAG: hypothetical protein C4329_04560 [Chitinophagaceae bacterium]
MYQLAVKIEGMEKRKRSTGLLHVLSGCFLLMGAANYFKYTHYQQFWSAAPSFAIALLSVVYGLFRTKWDVKAKYNPYMRLLQFVCFVKLGIAMVMVGGTWDYVSMLVWAAVSLMLLFTERKIFHDAQLLLKKDGIFIPGYFNSHHFNWSTLKDVVVRNDYITIFKANEKYLQFELLTDLNTLQLEEVNNFCKTQLNDINKPIETQ